MTEDEAKTKTCHKTLGPIASAAGSAAQFSPEACIGSACMAWRWAFPAEIEWNKNQAGYCGLAGKP